MKGDTDIKYRKLWKKRIKSKIFLDDFKGKR